MSLLIFLFGLSVFLLFIGFIFFLAISNYMERKRIVKKLMETVNRAEAIYYPIKYASSDRLEKYWKLFAWEKSGLLILQEPGVVIFRYSDFIGEIYDTVFNITLEQLEWEGADYFKNGFISWFLIEQEGKVHYFTSETGVFITNSRLTTKKIYKHIRSMLKAGSRQERFDA